MMLILHIAIAVTGILQTSYLLLVPSQQGLRVSYALLGLTLASDTFLVVSTGTHILQSCMMGLLYSGFVIFGMVRTSRVLGKNASL